VDGDVADDAVEGRGDAVVGELLLLLLAGGGRGSVIGFGVGVGLFSLVEGVFADDAGGEELALALHLKLVVLVNGELLLFGGGLGGERGFLLQGIDLHEELACGDAVAGVNEDAGDVAVNLGIDGGGAARLDGGDVFIGLRDGRFGNSEGLDGEGLHTCAGRRLRLRLVATCGAGEEQRQHEEWDDGMRSCDELHDIHSFHSKDIHGGDLHSDLHSGTSNKCQNKYGQSRMGTNQKQFRIQEGRGVFCAESFSFPDSWIIRFGRLIMRFRKCADYRGTAWDMQCRREGSQENENGLSVSEQPARFWLGFEVNRVRICVSRGNS
jgi:hypothetical protein